MAGNLVNRWLGLVFCIWYNLMLLSDRVHGNEDMTMVGCYAVSGSMFEEIDTNRYPARLYDEQRIGYDEHDVFNSCRDECALTYKKDYFAVKRNSAYMTSVRCYCSNEARHSVSGSCDYSCMDKACGGPSGYISVYSVCPRGFYSLPADELQLCFRRCHCANNDFCALIDGVCPHGCQQGWTGVDCDTDLDECSVLNGGCSHTCTNTAPGYRCGCQLGYRLDPNNVTCSDIDECTIHQHDCQLRKEQCWNTIGSHRCCPNDTVYNTQEDICSVEYQQQPVTVLVVSCTLGAGVFSVTIIVLSVCLYRSRRSERQRVRGPHLVSPMVKRELPSVPLGGAVPPGGAVPQSGAVSQSGAVPRSVMMVVPMSINAHPDVITDEYLTLPAQQYMNDAGPVVPKRYTLLNHGIYQDIDDKVYLDLVADNRQSMLQHTEDKHQVMSPQQAGGSGVKGDMSIPGDMDVTGDMGSPKVNHDLNKDNPGSIGVGIASGAVK